MEASNVNIIVNLKAFTRSGVLPIRNPLRLSDAHTLPITSARLVQLTKHSMKTFDKASLAQGMIINAHTLPSEKLLRRSELAG